MKRRLETGNSSKRVRRESEHFEELFGDGGQHQHHQQHNHRRKQQKPEPQSIEDSLKVTSISAPIFEDQLCALEIESGKLWIGISGNDGNPLSIDRYDARAILDDLKPYRSANNTPGILGGTRTRTIGKRGKRNEEDRRQLGVQLSKHLHEARWGELQSLVTAGIEGNDEEGESLKSSLDEFWKRRKLLAETLQKQKGEGGAFHSVPYNYTSKDEQEGMEKVKEKENEDEEAEEAQPLRFNSEKERFVFELTAGFVAELSAEEELINRKNQSRSGSEPKGTEGEGEAEEAERRLLESQKDNSYFSFLIPEHPLHSHYQSLKTKLRTALLDSI